MIDDTTRKLMTLATDALTKVKRAEEAQAIAETTAKDAQNALRRFNMARDDYALKYAEGYIDAMPTTTPEELLEWHSTADFMLDNGGFHHG